MKHGLIYRARFRDKCLRVFQKNSALARDNCRNTACPDKKKSRERRSCGTAEVVQYEWIRPQSCERLVRVCSLRVVISEVFLTGKFADYIETKTCLPVYPFALLIQNAEIRLIEYGSRGDT